MCLAAIQTALPIRASLRHNRIMPASLVSRPNIILVGFMGSGKSSIGRLLATKLGFQFVDTDQLIVQQVGLEISAIFERHGEPHFREAETSALGSLAYLERCVVATGGGIVLRERNRALLRELGFVVQLAASEEVILQRVSRNTRRPLLQTADPGATARQMLAERRPFYEQVAQFSIDTSHLNHTQVAETIITEARRAFSWQGAA